MTGPRPAPLLAVLVAAFWLCACGGQGHHRHPPPLPGVLTGQIRGPGPSAIQERPAPGLVVVSSPSGRVVARERLHGRGHHFRFRLVAGHYLVAEGAARGLYGCIPQHVVLHAGRTTRVTVAAGCDVY